MSKNKSIYKNGERKEKLMEKVLELLNKKVDDETAAFAILGAMVLTFSITIILFGIIK